MTFLAAAFLTGLAALGLPWWLHRREASSERERPVSSLLLMRPAETPVHARRVVRHRWLLALRLLLLMVLVLAFAQPVLERGSGADDSTGVVRPRLIVVDTSASMAADFAAARRLAHRLVDDLPSGARAAVLGAADDVAVLGHVTADSDTLHAAVAALRPGSGRLAFDGLAGRLTALAGTLADETVEIHLVSDFQRSALPAQFNALLTGAEGPVILHPVAAEPANWAVSHVTTGNEVSVTIRGLGTPRRRLEVVLSGAAGELGRQTVTVPPGGEATASFALPETQAQDRWLQAAIDAGDVLPADDVRFHVVPASGTVGLPVFASDNARSQLEYLMAAVGAAAPQFQPVEPEQAGPVAVVVDPGELAGDRVRLLQRHLDNGGGVLVTVGPATRRGAQLPLTEQVLTSGGMAEGPRGVMAVDRSHPAVTHLGQWHDVTVARYLTAAAPESGAVLAALDDGTPLLVEHRRGAGRVLVLMTALDPAWSTLVTRPAFVAFVADALAYLAEDTLPQAAVAGQALTIPADSAQLFDHEGRRLLSLGDTVGRPVVRLAEPGIYTLRTPSRQKLLAVNADVRESELVGADPDLLARWEDASQALATAPPGAQREAAGERTLPLAPWLLIALAALAMLEPVAANLARPRVAT